MALCLGFGSSADARPNYNKAFQAKYPDLEAAEKRPSAAFATKAWTRRSATTTARRLVRTWAARRVMDADQINGALDKVAGEPSAIDGKTFGDLIKDGKLPNTKP